MLRRPEVAAQCSENECSTYGPSSTAKHGYCPSILFIRDCIEPKPVTFWSTCSLDATASLRRCKIGLELGESRTRVGRAVHLQKDHTIDSKQCTMEIE